MTGHQDLIEWKLGPFSQPKISPKINLKSIYDKLLSELSLNIENSFKGSIWMSKNNVK